MRASAPLRSQGAELSGNGVRYRTWAPGQAHVAAVVCNEAGEPAREISLAAEAGGYFSGHDEKGRAGDRYRFRLGENLWPDPASRWQPDGVHGSSQVIDPAAFHWSDESWKSPTLRDLVIYELHIGTFTDDGTFRSAIDRLDHIAQLGANAIEIMPVADFPGDRNWGYDGVMLYAPARVYGHPDDLRALVDAAHARGLAVVLDVVYNHFGPDGNYLGVYSPEYFNAAHKTPWGDGFNFEAKPVRDFFVENAVYWMREFHFDGFRLDATHAIMDASERHVLAEIAGAVQASGGFVIAEDERNDPLLLRPRARGGLGLDGCWSDDFHHVVRVAITGQRESYFANFDGTAVELADTLEHGWLYRGQPRKTDGEPRGGACSELAPEQFVYCISNHDQTGNRAFGDRLHATIPAAAYRAASALLCLAPCTPMLFMGQEWGASTPFQFFTDHNDELGRLVTAGRREEFKDFAAFGDPATRGKIPDPQAVETFSRSKLRWDEIGQPEHAQTLLLYREFLALRRTHPAFRKRDRGTWRAGTVGGNVVALRLGIGTDNELLVVIDLRGGCEIDLTDCLVVGKSIGIPGRILLSSEERRFGGHEAARLDGTRFGTEEPAVVVVV